MRGCFTHSIGLNCGIDHVEIVSLQYDTMYLVQLMMNKYPPTGISPLISSVMFRVQPSFWGTFDFPLSLFLFSLSLSR